MVAWTKRKYKCTKCDLEIVVAMVEGQNLPKAECQDCGTMTMLPKEKTLGYKLK